MDIGSAIVAVGRASKRTKIGRKLSRRLSLVAKVPSIIQTKFRNDSSNSTQKYRAYNNLRQQQTRNFEITIIAPDKTQRLVVARSVESVRALVSPLLIEFELEGVSKSHVGAERSPDPQKPRWAIKLAGSLATVDPNAQASLLEGDILLVEAKPEHNPNAASDVRLHIVEELLWSERELAEGLGAATELYGRPLMRVAGFLSDPEHFLLFTVPREMHQATINRCTQLEKCLEEWNTEETKFGHLFSKQFWVQYDEYQDVYRKMKELLREKNATDEEFVEFCKLRRGAALHSLEDLLALPVSFDDHNELDSCVITTGETVQRLAQYESYFEAALGATRHEHPDFEDLNRATSKAKQAVRRCQEESDLERIQDLFPNDSLCLYDKDAVTMKMKGLMRKRSTTAARLQRALSTKTPPRDETPPNDAPRPEKRQFLMETAVQFTNGMQSQERHLFLFTDMLLVAKARSGGNFKLKEKVRVSEMWLSRCVDDVTEVTRSHETSMVLGWPTTNVVATYGTQAARDLWWAKLSEVIAAEREKEPRCTNIQVVYYDISTNIEYCKTFSVTANETARCCIRLALEHLEMRGLDPTQFQLWARTGRDEAPYPLIGHERPFAIKLSCLRDGLSTEEGFDLDHCNNIYGTDPLTRCQFILRNVRKLPDFASTPSEAKKSKKSRKSPMRIKQVFRRSVKGEDCVDSSPAPGLLFGLPLPRVCVPDGSPPPAVMAMLQQVFAKGPFTQGIFRKSANARLVREAREQLDAGASPASLEHVPVLVTAALLKDFLRSLPEPLLAAALYQDWLEAAECQPHDSEQDRLLRVKSVLDRLPSVNHCLLAHFLCVLYHVARRSSQNLMTAGNLGVCVGPSLLWGPCPTPASSRAVPALVDFLISRCESLMGSSVIRLMGEPPERDPLRQDSGAEESDSLHSGGLRRDDSSIDSLEREELLEPSPPPRKDKMSLSRDSGLTMSDSQLYTPDEEESGSTSSGLSGDTKAVRGGIYRPQPPASSTPPSRYDHSKLTATFSHPGTVSAPQPVPQTREYVRVYGGWEERIECCRKGTDESIYGKTKHSTPINSNFQRQDWFRQRSHLKRLNSGSKQSQNSSSCSSSSSSSSSGSGGNGNSNSDVIDHCNGNMLRRSASEESLLNSYNVSCSGKRPALHSKGRAPPPPANKCQDIMQTPLSRRRQIQQQQQRFPTHYSLSRSKSAHHLCTESSDLMLNDPLSQSLPVKPVPKTPVMQSEDWARSQSTPHIAAAAAGMNLDDIERSYDSSTLSDDDSTPHVSRSNSRGKDCPTSGANMIPSWDSFNIPPSYEETMTRRTSDLVRAAPVITTDSDQEVPPLPPKQRRSPTDNSTVKLRHLPPVHVKLEGSSSPNSPLKKAMRPMSYHPGDNGICVESLYAPVPNARKTCLESKIEEKVEPKSERRGRLRRRDGNFGASQRSKSLPPNEKQVESDEEPSQERRDSSPVRSAKQGEISWSVSQLRSLFGDSRPPPYRPPPRVVTIPNHRAPITTFHLGDSQSELHVARLLDRRRELSRVDSAESTSEEESYV